MTAAAVLLSGAAVLLCAAILGLVRLAFEGRRQRLLLDAAPESIFAVDAGGRIRYANARAAAQFQYEPRDLLGQPVEMLVPEHARAAHSVARREYGARPRQRPMGSGSDVQGLRRDGTTFPASISLNHVRIGHRTQVLCVVRDISEQHALHASMRDANAQLSQGLAEIGRRAADLKELADMGELLQCCVSEAELERVVAGAVRRVAPGSGGALYLGQRAQPSLLTGRAWGGNGSLPPSALERGACWALRRGRLHGVLAGTTSARCEHAACDAALHHVCVPMLAHGETLGVLSICTADEALARELVDGPKRRIVQALAAQTALAVGNLRLREQLTQASLRDPLTDLYNRRHFDASLERELRRATRSGRPLTLLAIDVDRFKPVNDRHGHAAGDEVLRGIARVLGGVLRVSDVPCRVGGEEFCVLLPETDEAGGCTVAEGLRAAIAAQPFALPDGSEIGVTVSVGVATSAGGPAEHAAQLVARADRALYAAKAGGRNAVATASAVARTGCAA